VVGFLINACMAFFISSAPCFSRYAAVFSQKQIFKTIV
jgi:hypothetical protein